MGRRTSLALRGSAVAMLIALGVWPARATADDQGTHTVEVKASAEAWYAQPEAPSVLPATASPLPDTCTLLGPLCTLVPQGPAPAPAAVVYPLGTLHVEATAGQSTARTYLVPDLSAIPPDATVTSALLTLPLTKQTEGGNRSVETAELVGCVTTGQVTDKVYGDS